MIALEAVLTTPILLDSRTKDSMRLVISDDLSGLVEFRAVARGIEKKI